MGMAMPLSFRPSEARAGIHNPGLDVYGNTGVMDSGFAGHSASKTRVNALMPAPQNDTARQCVVAAPQPASARSDNCRGWLCCPVWSVSPVGYSPVKQWSVNCG